ncbi:MAG TPA: hypothetical protein VMP01_01930 [Pirellulaceae bacterium]|nr:hypothetical protein [Pirellulaceae bacterium]
MRTVLLLAVLGVALVVAGLVISSLTTDPSHPQTIHNPYVDR